MRLRQPTRGSAKNHFTIKRSTLYGFWITSLHPDYSCQALLGNSVEGNPQSSHFHVSSHLPYLPFPLSFFRLVCLPPRLQAGEDASFEGHRVSFAPSHTQANVAGPSAGLSESFFFFFFFLHTWIIKKHFSRSTVSAASPFFSFLFPHPPSEEFNKTGEMDVRDGCRSDSYPFFFFFFPREMDGCRVARSRLASGGPIVGLIACNQSHVQYGFWIISHSTSHWAPAISCGDKLRKESLSFAS